MCGGVCVSGSGGRAGRSLGDSVAVFKPEQADCQRAIIGSEGQNLRLLHPDRAVKATGLTGWFVSVFVWVRRFGDVRGIPVSSFYSPPTGLLINLI